MPIRKVRHPVFPWLEEPTPEQNVEWWAWKRGNQRHPYQYREEFGRHTVPDSVAYLAAQGMGEPFQPLNPWGTARDSWGLRWPAAQPWSVALVGEGIYRAASMRKKIEVRLTVAKLDEQGQLLTADNLTMLHLAEAIRHYERTAWVLGAPIEPTGSFWVQKRTIMARIAPALDLDEAATIGMLADFCGELRAVRFLDHAVTEDGRTWEVYVIGFYGCHPDLELAAMRQRVTRGGLVGIVPGANGGIFLAVQVPLAS